jgi:hypothetical protein
MFYELEGIACAGGLYGRHRPAQSRQLASRIRSGPPFMARHAAPREVSQRIGSTSERCAPCCDGRPDGRRCRSGYSRRCRPIRRTAAGWALRQRTLSPIWRDFGGQGGPRRLAAAQIRMIGARSAVREVYAMPANNRRYARIEPLSTRFVGHSASFPNLGSSRDRRRLWLAVTARLRASGSGGRRSGGGLLRPTQKQHKFRCRRRSTRR